MFNELTKGLRFTVTSMLLFGGGYVVLVWGIGQAAFPSTAGGSLIRLDGGRVVGSRLIGQRFTRPEYFHPRPSAADYNARSAGGSNLGPSNPAHLANVRERLDVVAIREGVPPGQVSAELITTSASGLDPHLPPSGVDLQVPRIARARGVSIQRVRDLVRAHTEGPTFGFLGRARINVLELNLALDREWPVPVSGPDGMAPAPTERTTHGQ